MKWNTLCAMDWKRTFVEGGGLEWELGVGVD